MAWLVAAMAWTQSLTISFEAADQTLPFTGSTYRGKVWLCSHALSLGLQNIRLKPEPQPVTSDAESHPGEDREIWK